MEQLFVVKKNGEQELYSEEKVINSMRRVGVPEEIQPEVLSKLRKSVRGHFISTDHIYSEILNYLEPRDKGSSLRFSLRQAIFALGPTGFPFEKYLARIFQKNGFKTLVDQHIQGECAMHEVDLVLERDNEKRAVEVKFHNDKGVKTDVRVALYTYARFLDISKGNKITSTGLITNTKLTTDAIHYCRCKNIMAIAWNYPSKGGLQDLIQDSGMYPITIIPDLSRNDYLRLFEDNIILTSDLLGMSEHEAKTYGLVNRSRLRRAIESAKLLSRS